MSDPEQTTYRTKAEIARRIGVSVQTLRDWSKEPQAHWQFRAIRIEGENRWLMDESHYRRELARNTAPLSET